MFKSHTQSNTPISKSSSFVNQMYRPSIKPGGSEENDIATAVYYDRRGNCTLMHTPPALPPASDSNYKRDTTSRFGTCGVRIGICACGLALSVSVILISWWIAGNSSTKGIYLFFKVNIKRNSLAKKNAFHIPLHRFITYICMPHLKSQLQFNFKNNNFHGISNSNDGNSICNHSTNDNYCIHH